VLLLAGVWLSPKGVAGREENSARARTGGARGGARTRDTLEKRYKKQKRLGGRSTHDPRHIKGVKGLNPFYQNGSKGFKKIPKEKW
jgi:hypothetical protein